MKTGWWGWLRRSSCVILLTLTSPGRRVDPHVAAAPRDDLRAPVFPPRGAGAMAHSARRAAAASQDGAVVALHGVGGDAHSAGGDVRGHH